MAHKVLQKSFGASSFLLKSSRTSALYRPVQHFHYAGNSSSSSGGWNHSSKSKYGAFAATAATAASAFALFNVLNESSRTKKTAFAKSMPVFTAAEVSSHSSKKDGIWVTYKDGVYDISDFVQNHPGGDKILLAAGGPIDPFWNMYQVHQHEDVLKMLSEFKIGTLSPEDMSKAVDLDDPFANEPTRLPLFRVNAQKPFNAEPPPKVVADSFITPNELFYVRNHLPVPKVDPKTFRLEIVVGDRTIKLSLDELKRKYKPVTITTTIQCAGNRREEMSLEKEVKGLSWGLCAISTARWTGPRLRDVLLDNGLDPADAKVKHIHFTGLDADMTKSAYGASVPKAKALSEDGDVILAYQMNGVDIPRDHGYPIRAIVPGNVGARNVKWVHQIVASDVESFSFWQRSDYKGFSPSTTQQTADYSKATSIQELPVVSAITTPNEGDEIDEDDDSIEVRGYAWSGGGRDIIRVEVSADDGKTWQEADLHKNPEADDSSHNWAWTLWDAEVPVTGGKMKIMCRAIDSSFNSQPENASSIWNLRGFMMNSWHRVCVNVKEEDCPCGGCGS